MDNSLDLRKQSIEEYMESNIEFGLQLNDLLKHLNSKPQIVVKFVHEIDINFVVNNQQNKILAQHLIQNVFQVISQFKECIFQKMSNSSLNGRKLWLILKPKNLPQNYCIKSYRQMSTNNDIINRKSLISIDCLQIVSMSCDYKSVIAKKFVNNDNNSNHCEWKLREMNEMKADLFSTNSKFISGPKVETISVSKRKLMVIIGNEAKSGLNPLEITLYCDAFTEQQLENIYLGSHLVSVVLTQTYSSIYLMLSFEKIVQKVTIINNPFDENHFYNNFLMRFPADIRKLYEDRKVSNYSFGLSLAYVFGDNICASGSYFRLKLGLLLSLLSINEYPKKKDSSVLVVSNDTFMINRLMDWSSLFSANRYLQTSTIIPMSGVSRKQSKSSLEWIDGGSLQLAADGICAIICASDLNELPEKEKNSLFHALETNEVIPKLSPISLQLNNQIELKSTIWAAVESHSLNKPNSQIAWNQLFGMVYVIEDQLDDRCFEPPEERSLTRDIWHNVIDLCNQLTPIMTEEAEVLLQNYYVTIRRFRGSNCNHISLETLVSLSKSFAKLSIRPFVTKYDTLMAIMLYEESLTARFPHFVSPLNVKPISHVTHEDIDWAIGRDCDQLILQFEERLLQFLKLPKTPKRTPKRTPTFLKLSPEE